MIDFSEAMIEQVIFHRISNEAGKSFLSDTTYEYQGGEEEETLKRIFLKPFSTAITTYEFRHSIDLDLNPLYSISKDLHNGEEFVKKSQDIFKHLSAVSKHPNIKDGELFVLQYEEIKFNNKFYDALGIYKVENKENYLETVSEETAELGLHFRKGISGKKMDKACLIIFTESAYTVLIVDNGSTETDYWKNEFVNVAYKKDNVNDTNRVLDITKSFVIDILPSTVPVSKPHQIDLLNRSVDYFKSNQAFEKDEFESSVLQDKDIIKSFRKYNKQYEEENEVTVSNSFEISPEVVKKQARIFKSVLKLDKNFHVYIHGNTDLIEKGIDRDGRKFYKIFYEEEA